jgi:hypothetical protein
MAYKDLFIRMKVIQQIVFYKMKNNASPQPSLSFTIKQELFYKDILTDKHYSYQL